MAKKKHHKKGRHRRRRVGALSMNASSPLVMAGAIAAGYFLDSFVGINDKIDTAITPATATSMSPMYPNLVLAGELGLGGYLLLSKKKSMVKTVSGGVAVGLGIHRLLKEMKIITGYQNTPVIGKRRVHGYQSTPVIGGIPGQLQGYNSQGSGVLGRVPGQLQGYGSQGSGVGDVEYRNGSGYMN